MRYSAALLLDRGQYQSAADAFAEVLRVVLTNRQANVELGSLHLRAGKGVEAE